MEDANVMETTTSYQKQIRISKATQDIVTAYKKTSPNTYDRFSMFFHLRPRANDVTIVSTHPDCPMRGINISISKVAAAMAQLADCVNTENGTVDWTKITKLTGEAFVAGYQNQEFFYQMNMINHMENNQKLKALLQVKNLYFTASEVVFSRGQESRKRIDIVAHNGMGKVFFFELKAPENRKDDPISQVKGYLKLYGKGGMKNLVFEEMMANYPQNPITNITEYAGYGVVGYGNTPLLQQKMLLTFQ